MNKTLTSFGALCRRLWKIFSTGVSLLSNLLFLTFVLILLSLFYQPEVVVPQGAALVIAPAGNIVEETASIDPFSRMINGYAGIPIPRETLLQDIIDAVDAAANDPRIAMLVLSLKDMEYSGLDQLRTIGERLAAFKKSGKKVIAAEDDYTQNQYYLASFADEIYLNPMGGVHLRGFGVFRLYVKELIDRLAVNFHVFKVGSFKSAVEPFTRSNMSDEDRQANQLWLGNLWSFFCADIARNRKIAQESINDLINGMPEHLRRAEGSTGKMALAARLVDGLKTRPEIRAHLINLVGEGEEKGTFNQIHFADYLTTITPSFTGTDKNKNRIGLLVAQGDIVYGEEDMPGQISADYLCKLIRRAREDDTVKAVVLRIDSGGGSAFASEQIRQELLLLRKEGKPLVVSMGTLAASGAYWIAAGADRILASPFTLTGSIGIFGIMPTFEHSITKIGIASDGTGTTKMAGAENPTLPLTPELEQSIQLSVEEGYGRFINIVADGRSMAPDAVREIAEGRVWDGTNALDLGLIDELGNLDDAIEIAAELADLTDYETTYIRETGLSAREFFRRIGLRSQAALPGLPFMASSATPLLRAMAGQFRFLAFARDPAGIYAHCLLPHPTF
ncbi:MAG: signal peptide peptidase SppA [Desulfobulbaceae bacterium]